MSERFCYDPENDLPYLELLITNNLYLHIKWLLDSMTIFHVPIPLRVRIRKFAKL